MTRPSLAFLHNEAEEKEGLADAGIETFRDSPYAGCAREAGQNSRDAEAQRPVRLTFNVRHVETDSLPGHASLASAIDACEEQAQEGKETEFFRVARQIIASDRLPILEIADYNTKGLVGPPNVAGTPFYSLLKSSGVSTKDSETSGGSFGIGKNASFAVSDLQMVLYSTIYSGEHGEPEFAAQGKVRLISHRDAAGTPRRATGYWGDPQGFKAITDQAQVPAWMRREETGTSIYSLGFRPSGDWAAQMAASLISNFFAAVQREEMEFEVDNGAIRINRNTLEGMFSEYRIRGAATEMGALDEFQFASDLHRCLISPSATTHTLSIVGAGTFTARLLVEAKLPRRIGFVRNGMLITDNLKHFNHALARFPSAKDFVCLVEPGDDNAAKLFKDLENPAHNSFSAERLRDLQKRRIATRVMKMLGDRLRELVNSEAGVGAEASVVLEELGRFFAFDGKGAKPADDAERDAEKYVYKPPRVTTPKRTAPTPEGGSIGGRPGTGGTGDGPGGGSGRVPGAGTGAAGPRSRAQSVALDDVRNALRPDGEGRPVARLVRFTPEAGGLLELRVEATGVFAPEDLSIVGTSFGKIHDGHIRLVTEQGQRITLRIEFAEPYDGPIEVSASALPDGGEDANQ